MKENEAIEKLKNMRLFMQIEDENNGCKFREDDYKANEMAIQALEEVQQYRTIGTLEELQDMKSDYSEALSDWRQYRKIGTFEECRTAREKQIPKKPTYEGDGYAPDGTLVYDTWICPCCDKRYEVGYDDYDYCPNCGQKLDLDWSDEE